MSDRKYEVEIYRVRYFGEQRSVDERPLAFVITAPDFDAAQVAFLKEATKIGAKCGAYTDLERARMRETPNGEWITLFDMSLEKRVTTSSP